MLATRFRFPLSFCFLKHISPGSVLLVLPIYRFFFLLVAGIRPQTPPELNIDSSRVSSPYSNNNSGDSNNDNNTPAKLLFPINKKKPLGPTTSAPNAARGAEQRNFTNSVLFFFLMFFWHYRYCSGVGSAFGGKPKQFVKPRFSSPLANNNNSNNSLTPSGDEGGNGNAPSTPLSVMHKTQRFKPSESVFNLNEHLKSEKISLKQFAVENPPRKRTAHDLSELGIRPEVITMTSQSAKTFVFRQPFDFPVDPDLIPISASQQQMENGEIGPNEMMTAMIISMLVVCSPLFIDHVWMCVFRWV